MNTTQIIIVIAAILGSGITGYWICRYATNSKWEAIYWELVRDYNNLDDTNENLLATIQMQVQTIGVQQKTIQRYQKARNVDKAIIEAYREESFKHTKLVQLCREKFKEFVNSHPEVFESDYSSVPADILPDKDIRINTGNNHC